jgi:hypothetical protein
MHTINEFDPPNIKLLKTGWNLVEIGVKTFEEEVKKAHSKKQNRWLDSVNKSLDKFKR